MRPKGLNLIERLAWAVLYRSKRIGLLVAKMHDNHDVICRARASDPEAIHLLGVLIDELEPPSLQLERQYHAPSYGENQ
jgi:hypothetical protein